MDVLNLVPIICTVALGYISHGYYKKIKELEKEVERLTREKNAKQNFDDLCKDIENHLTDTRQ